MRREETKQRRSETSPRDPNVDPDIAGIVPGPQPNPWLDDLEDDAARKKKIENSEDEVQNGLGGYSRDTSLSLCVISFFIRYFRRAFVSCATPASVVCAAFNPNRKSLSVNVAKTSVG